MRSEQEHRDAASGGGSGGQTVYEIRVQGMLRPCWSEWFGGLEVMPLANGETLLTGPVVDQAALNGILMRIRDLNLPLISVQRLGGG